MEWIRIEDRKPTSNSGDVYDEYITYCQNNERHVPIVTALDWTEHGWYDDKGGCWNEFVTHWMILPEPPKAI